MAGLCQGKGKQSSVLLLCLPACAPVSALAEHPGHCFINNCTTKFIINAAWEQGKKLDDVQILILCFKESEAL